MPESGRPDQKTMRAANGHVRPRVFGTIRNKIILPFLLLTLFVTMLGTFVVTRLVAANVQDRLTNQLLESSRAASDSIVVQEEQHLEILQLAVFTVGFPDGLREGRYDDLTTSLLAVAANQNAYAMAAVDMSGHVVADVKQGDFGYETGRSVGLDVGMLPMVSAVLSGQQDEFGDKYAGTAVVGDELLLITAAPVRDASQTLVGAVLVETPVVDLLTETKSNVLADMTLYGPGGEALQSTHIMMGQSSLEALDITPATFEAALRDSESDTEMRQYSLNGRPYQAAYVPLRIRRDTLGVLGASWPASIVTSLITTNRNGLSVVFSLVAVLVVLIGFAVAQNLTAPIQRLADTARAVSAGDMSRQSGVRTRDEIGVLGRTFDFMTVKLEERTKAVQQEAAYLRAVIASAGDGTVVVGRDGKIMGMNPVANDLLTSDEGLWQEMLVRLVSQASNGGHTPERVESNNQWIDALAAPVVTASGDDVGVVVTLRDVTDQVLTERMRTAFILQMSHELYTPLSAFKGYAELANAALDDNSQASSFLGQALGSADVVSRMIGQMLDVAGMMRGGFAIEREPVDMGQVVRMAVDEHGELAETNGLNLEMKVGNVGTLDGDAQRLHWAVSNLVRNACEYTPSGGTVSVVASRGENWIVLHVRDTGVGISAREQPRIFEQFYRGTPVTPNGEEIDTRGVGLGLFVVDQVVRAHGGEVSVRSKTGEGTEFVVRLPLGAAVDDSDGEWG